MDLKNYIKQNKKGCLVLGGILLFTAAVGITRLADHAKKSGMFKSAKPKAPAQAEFKEPKNSRKKSKVQEFEQFWKKFSDENEDNIPSNSKYIAQIDITGTITDKNDEYNQEWLLRKVEKIQDDSNNMGLILYIDSPGGGVYQADELYLKLMDYKKKTSRPVYAYFGPLAASGGYYIGCAADYIMANRNTLTGSIGVISGQFIDLSGLMEKYGIKSETIHSGRNKTMGSVSNGLNEEQREIMQAISDECYEQFTQIVADSRSMELSKVQELADGRIYTAKQALSNGLIDSIGSLEDLKETMSRKAFDFNEYEVINLKYEKIQNWFALLSKGSEGISKGTVSVDPLPECVEKAINPEVRFPAYLYEF